MRVKLKRLISAAAFALLFTCVMAPSAFATGSTTWPIPTSPIDDTVVAEDGNVKTVVTASANGCYRSFPEILGLNNPLCNPGLGASVTTGAEDALAAMTTDPDYGLYGSPANNTPDCYMWNYYYNFYAATVGAELADPDLTAITCNATAAGFDTTYVEAYGTNAALYHRPDIAYGVGTVNADGTCTYTEFVESINNLDPSDERYREGDESYDPYLIDCRGDYGEKFFHVTTLYDLAEAAQSVIDDSVVDGVTTKTTRYGDDPYEYAIQFEKYCRASQYAVLQAIDEGTVERKTVAYIGDYDTATGIIKIFVTDPQSTSFEECYQNVGTWGATCIRYMYAPNILENITDNLGDVLGKSVESDGFYYVTADELMQCDSVIIRTGNGLSDCDASYEEIRVMLSDAGFTDPNEYPAMYYKYTTYPGGGGGNYAWVAFYGSILGFVYPEVLNPVELEAYYCETIYHTASDYLEDAVTITCGTMSLPAGVTLSLDGYTMEKIDAILDAGLQWYKDNEEYVDSTYPNLVATEYLKNTLPDSVSSLTTMPLYGADRYATMQALVEKAFSYSRTVVIATGENFPDALAASGLAGVFDNAPIILTTEDSLGTEARELIEELGAANAIIIGGTPTISLQVERDLEAMGLTVDRIAGSNRLETSLEILNYQGGESWGQTAIVTTGARFADALSASSFAYANKYPIVLVDDDGNLSDAALTSLTDGRFTDIVVLGDTNSVSNATVTALRNAGLEVERLAGSDRYATSAEIVNYVTSLPLSEGGLLINNCIIATGEKFPDALAAAPVAGSYRSVVLLASDGNTDDVVAILSSHASEISQLYYAGDENTVSASVKRIIESALS